MAVAAHSLVAQVVELAAGARGAVRRTQRVREAAGLAEDLDAQHTGFSIAVRREERARENEASYAGGAILRRIFEVL